MFLTKNGLRRKLLLFFASFLLQKSLSFAMKLQSRRPKNCFTISLGISVTILSNFLHFGQLFKAFGNN